MKRKKRCLGLLLAALMTCTLLPSYTFAEVNAGEEALGERITETAGELKEEPSLETGEISEEAGTQEDAEEIEKNAAEESIALPSEKAQEGISEGKPEETVQPENLSITAAEMLQAEEGESEALPFEVTTYGAIKTKDNTFKDASKLKGTYPALKEGYKNVFVLQQPGIQNGYQEVMEGYLFSETAEIKLEGSNPEEMEYEVTHGTGSDGKRPFKVTRIDASRGGVATYKNIYGDNAVKVTVTDRGTSAIYYFIYENLLTGKKGINQLAFYDADSLEAIQVFNKKELQIEKGKSQLYELDVPDAIKYLKLQLSPDSYYLDRNSLAPFSGYRFATSNNQISLNGDVIGTFDASTSIRGADRMSQQIALKKGLNVLEVQSESRLLRPMSYENRQSGEVINSGVIVETHNHDAFSYVFLFDWNGEEETVTEGADTSLDYLDATLVSMVNPATEYKTKLNIAENTHQITLPREMPTSATSATGYKKAKDALLYVGIRPTDPAATYSVKVPDGSYLLGGEADENRNINGRVGIYSNIYVLELDGTPIESFEVEVTAGDGKTKTLHTIKLVHADDSTGISDFVMEGARLAPGMAFSAQKNSYKFIPDKDSTELTFSGKLPSGGGLSIGGTAVEAEADGTFRKSIPMPDYSVRLEVTAQDGVTKSESFFLRMNEDKTIPYFGITEETKAVARKMLTGYRKDKEKAGETQTANYASSYWSVFMAASAGVSMDGGYAYDVTKHTYKQTTDYAAVILELVMLGENPYDFKGHNYVQEMIDNGGGPWACNIWYVMAAKAAGIDCSQFVEELKANSVNLTYDPDMRSWCIAALRGIVPEEELANYADKLQERLVRSGNYIGEFYYQKGGEPNVNTQGCILSALATVGVDPEKHFSVEGNGTLYTPLTMVKERHMNEAGMFQRMKNESFGWNKDIIIGLGDLVNGGSVWDRYALTSEKFDALLKKAEAMKDGTPEQQTALSSALSAAKTAKKTVGEGEVIGLGKVYYDLYAAMSAVDTTMKAQVKYGTPYAEFQQMMAALPDSETLTLEDKADIKECTDFYEKWLKELDIYWDGFIGKEALEIYRSAQKKILALEGTEATASVFERMLALPDADVITLSDKAEVEAVTNAYALLNAEQKALIAWAGSSVLGHYTQAKDMIEKLDSGAKQMTVSFTLAGVPKHGSEGKKYVYAENPQEFEEWIPKAEYTFNGESVSVYKVFIRGLQEYNLDQVGAENNYISKIKGPDGTWLGEFDNGSNSGWMYMVNGKHPLGGLLNDNMKDGDSLIWHYTDDYTKEEGSEQWEENHKPGSSGGSGGGSSAVETKKDTKVSLDVKATADSSGKAKAAFTEKEMKTALAQALKNVEGQKNTAPEIQLNVKTNSGATVLETSFAKASAEALAKAETALEITSALGTVRLEYKVMQEIQNAAKGQEICLRIEKIEPNTGSAASLNEAQKNAAGENTVYEVSIISDNQKITSFGSKKLTISLPYTLKAEENTADVGAWYLDELGGLSKLTSKYDKTAKLVSFDINHLSSFIVGSGIAADGTAAVFHDVKSGQWYYDSVMYLSKAGIVNGTGENIFSPNASVTRAEFAQILYGMAKSRAGKEGSAVTADSVKADGSKAASQFSDVKQNDWYASAVEWAYINGVAKGAEGPDGKAAFLANARISRQDMAVMIQNYIEKIEKKAITELDTEKKFADEKEIASYAKEAVSKMQKGGIINGIKQEDGSLSFAPKANATRAEAATMIANYLIK